MVALGGMFLLAQVFRIDMWRFFWPFFVIVPGAMFFVGMVLGGKPAGPLAIPGSIVSMTGLLLLYQSVTNHWESWAYAWALIFPTSVGVGLVINGVWSNVDRLTRSGMKWITAGAIIFLAGGAFFEMLIFRNFLGRVVLPGLLIVLGAYLLLRRGRGLGMPRTQQPPQTEARPIEQAPKEAQTEFEPLDMTRGRDR
jgi:hypothetical protein